MNRRIRQGGSPSLGRERRPRGTAGRSRVSGNRYCLLHSGYVPPNTSSTKKRAARVEAIPVDLSRNGEHRRSGRQPQWATTYGLVAGSSGVPTSTLVDMEQRSAVLYRCGRSRLARSSGRASDRSQARSSGSTRRANELRGKPAHEGMAPAHPGRRRSRGDGRSRCRPVVRGRGGVRAAQRRRCRRRADPEPPREDRRHDEGREALQGRADTLVRGCQGHRLVRGERASQRRHGCAARRRRRSRRSGRRPADRPVEAVRGRLLADGQAGPRERRVVCVRRPLVPDRRRTADDSLRWRFPARRDRRGARPPATRNGADSRANRLDRRPDPGQPRTRGRWA